MLANSAAGLFSAGCQFLVFLRFQRHHIGLTSQHVTYHAILCAPSEMRYGALLFQSGARTV